ncbi:MAG: STAS/SEC14 domain-containing protein [Acidobacteriota bacterium]
MPTIQIEADLSPDQLLSAARQLPNREFDQLVGWMLGLRAERIAPVLPAKESDLLKQINLGLPPADAGKMKALIAKRQSYAITEDELQELIRLTDESERLNVERLKRLLELAHLRGVTLDEVMAQLGIKPAAL